MKKIQCEVCGSNDIIKTDENVFQCQYCGTKYTLEQAKVLFSGVVQTKAVDFEVVGGKLIKYHGESTEAVVPENVSIIGASAFSGVNGLKSVKLPNGLISIEEFAFEGCASLTEITLPLSLKEIGFKAFSGCTNLKPVYVPDGVKLSEYSFDDIVKMDTQWKREGLCAHCGSPFKGKFMKYCPKCEKPKDY